MFPSFLQLSFLFMWFKPNLIRFGAAAVTRSSFVTNDDIGGRSMHVDDLSKLNNIFSNIFACSFGNSMNLQVVFSCILFHVIYLGYRRFRIFVEDVVDICPYLDTIFKLFIFFFERRQFCIFNWSLNIPLILRIAFSYHSFLPIVCLCSHESCLGLSRRYYRSLCCLKLFKSLLRRLGWRYLGRASATKPFITFSSYHRRCMYYCFPHFLFLTF